MVAHDPERVSQALQRDDGVLVGDVIADIDDPNPGNKSTSHLAAPGSILGIPKDISLGETNLMLQRFIDGPAYRQVDRGLIMSIEPSLYWLVAS